MGLVGSISDIRGKGHRPAKVMASGGTPTPTPPMTAIAADGWQATVTTPADLSFLPASVSRAGYDATGDSVTVSDAVLLTRRVRQAYANQALDTANNVALNDYILASDTISGVTNNSTLVSPKPFGAWMMMGRSLVGNSIPWEMIAFHYFGRAARQVACVRVRATDGTNTTDWQTVSTTSISTYCEDGQPLETYSGSLDISGLNTGMVTLQGQALPFVGSAIMDTADSAVTREFSPRYFLKNVAREAAPPYAYVASTGNDSTGVWSTTAATAAATPFLTVGGALMAANDAVRGTPATGGVVDGGRIRIVDTVSLGTTTTSRPQNVAAVTVERAPGTARAAAIATLSSAMRCRLGVGSLTSPLTEGCIRFEDMTISRTANTTFSGEAANQLNVQMRNVTIANGGTAGTWLANAHDWFFGVNLTGFNGNLGQTALQHRMMRGLIVDFANGNAPEAWVTVGCQFTRVKGCSIADPTKGAIWYNNKFLNPDSTTAPITFAGTVSGGNLGAVAIVGNLVEVTHTTSSTPAIRVASDNALGNITHAVIAYNTTTGYGSTGRWNILYDEATVARFHKFARIVGNVVAQLNTKGDVFHADGTRLGQFAFTHGVGSQGNMSMFAVNSATLYSEYQTYPGIGANIGASTTVRNNPLFVDYQGTGGSGGTPSAGAGGGDYHPQSGSPLRGIVTTAIMGFDLSGVARASSNDDAGAYVYAA